jgi:hypothetical protein
VREHTNRATPVETVASQEAMRREGKCNGSVEAMDWSSSSIPEKRFRLRNLLRSISPPPPRHLYFLNWIAKIEVTARTGQSHRLLDDFLRALKNAPDGPGSMILNGDRFTKFLEWPSDDDENEVD